MYGNLTNPMLASGIKEKGYVVFNNRPCQVNTIKKVGKNHKKRHFYVTDIFNGKTHDFVVDSSVVCDIPFVNHTCYQLIDIKDGFVNLLLEKYIKKQPVKLPTDDHALLTKIMEGYEQRKELVVEVISSMNEEKICDVKDA